MGKKLLWLALLRNWNNVREPKSMTYTVKGKPWVNSVGDSAQHWPYHHTRKKWRQTQENRRSFRLLVRKWKVESSICILKALQHALCPTSLSIWGQGFIWESFSGWFHCRRNWPGSFLLCKLTSQTRGWFYTLLVISTILFDQPPFKNLIVNGLVLAR